MLPILLRRLCVLGLCAAWLACGQTLPAQAASTTDAADPAGVEFFEKKVRPLLAARCHECHGPNKQKGNLRLDSRAAVLKGGDTSAAVVPHKPEESLLVDAIRYGDMYQMPPKSQLPPDEIATLVEWVRIGAPWGAESSPAAGAPSPAAAFDLAARAKHWSFQPVAQATPPQVKRAGWDRTAIDRFILARLETAGLQPTAPADKRALLRRITFDLIGLPPTPAEMEAFLSDESTSAYDKVVERLLASPHYGERWGRHWLDLVRYAETLGHEFDIDLPNAYRYRDYVIRAFNADLPYDQFVIEHLAGDLLAAPRRNPSDGCNESIIATGCFFLGEAKHAPVDVRQDEADRVDNQIDVLAKTFLGLTVSCARCHDHKFDAISTKDYYALAGYLQSSRFQQAYIDPPDQLADSIAALKKLRADRARVCDKLARDVLAPQAKQLASALLASDPPPDWRKYLRETARANVDDLFHAWAVLQAPAQDTFAERRELLAGDLKARLDASESGQRVFADFSPDSFATWQATGIAFATGPLRPLDILATDAPGAFPIRMATRAAADSGLLSPKLRGVLRSPTFEITSPKIFYRIRGTAGEVRLIVDGLQLLRNPIYGGLKVDTGPASSHWHEQDVSKWIGHRAYVEVVDEVDGSLALEEIVFASAQPAAQPNRLVAEMLTDPTITSLDALAQKYQALIERTLAEWLANPDRRDARAGDRSAIIAWLFEQPLLSVAASEVAGARAELAAIAERQRAIESALATPRQAMALVDGTAENEHVFIRGSHKTLGDEVPRRFLEALGGTRHAPPEVGSGRLELARQFASAENPLLARVIVNRLWQHHFGEGFVRSVDDFGVMGQPPTHPELLDFLAGELVRERWSLKQLHRLMVLSSTYQMSHDADSAAEQLDPQNKLLHRMNVRRLEAECVRDAILAVSGRLDRAQFGPGVMPHLTAHMTGRGRPDKSGPLDGAGRRSIYLAVRRNFLSPMFLAFDYPIPFTTIGRRSTSNVPAQALSMMNNPFVIEQSRLWAERVLSGPDRSVDQRIDEMYLTAFGRPSEPAERQAAQSFLNDACGPNPSDPQGWAEFAHVLFNVKEFIFIP